MADEKQLVPSDTSMKSKSSLSNFTFVLLIGVALVGSLALIFLFTRGGAVTDAQGAREELTGRVENAFSQRLSIPKDTIVVELGSEDPLLQLENHTARDAKVSVTVGGEKATELLAELTDVPKEWVGVSGGNLRFGGTFDVPLLGKTGVGVSQDLATLNGDLTSAPNGFYLSGVKVPADRLTEIPLVGDWVRQFTVAQNHCIVDHVPNGFELREITVNGSTLTMNFAGEDVSLSPSQLQKTVPCDQ